MIRIVIRDLYSLFSIKAFRASLRVIRLSPFNLYEFVVIDVAFAFPFGVASADCEVLHRGVAVVVGQDVFV